MEVHIISRETIKPSSPTPLHLRTHHLSLLDQLAADIYFPIILFYSAATKLTSHHLKKSLSETLNHYYPFAGRLRDDFTIHCDDSGVTFVEARVANEMSRVLKQVDVNLTRQLTASDARPGRLSCEDVMVAVQVNYFTCGGVAICVAMRHVVVDGTAAANFVKNWATVACGGGKFIKDVIYNCSSVFPKQDLQDFWGRIFQSVKSIGEPKTKRFRFDGAKIDAAREKICWRPTRLEVVSTLIWGAVIAAARERGDTRPNVAFMSVNLRKRLNPQLPEQTFGNVNQRAIVKLPMGMEEIVDHSVIAREIHDSIKMMNNENARKLNEGGGLLKHLRDLNEGYSQSNVYNLTGWCRMALYEADFGWGKPCWVSTAVSGNVTYLLDTSDGEGIEALVGLPQDNMLRFQKNSDILAYASFED